MNSSIQFDDEVKIMKMQSTLNIAITLAGITTYWISVDAVNAASFTNINDFVSSVQSPTVITFTESPPFSSGLGPTFSEVQDGTFAPNPQFQKIYATLGVVFSEGAAGLGRPVGNDNGPGVQPGGKDAVLVGNFGFDSPALGAFFVDPQTLNGFVSPSQAVAVGGEVITPGTVTLYAFDPGGNLINSVTRNGSGFLGITSAIPMAAIAFEYDVRSPSGLDTFIFEFEAIREPEGVPEPLTPVGVLAVMGLGVFLPKKKRH